MMASGSCPLGGASSRTSLSKWQIRYPSISEQRSVCSRRTPTHCTARRPSGCTLHSVMSHSVTTSGRKWLLRSSCMQP